MRPSGPTLSRRAVLSAAGLPAVAILAGNAGRASASEVAVPGQDEVVRTCDVVVCGGGLSGMTAALRLHQQGADVMVVEAAGRLGGRTLTRTSSAGMPLDLGAQYVGPTQTRVLALAKELGVSTFKAYGDGDGLLAFQGKQLKLPGGDLVLADSQMAEFGSLAEAIGAIASTVVLDAPQRTPQARELDAVTFASWIDANAKDPLLAGFFRLLTTALLGCMADEISLLFMAYYIAQGDSLEMLMTTRDGAQDSRFEGGTQQFSTLIGERIGAERYLLSAPVLEIAQTDGAVRVRTAGGVISARQAIVAMPPSAADLIRFEPELPWQRRELQVRSPMGRYMKAIALYDRPFWKDKGLNGEALGLDGHIFGAFDESDAHGYGLLAFVAGDKLLALREKSEAERRTVILDELAAFFGEPARTPSDYVEYDWGQDAWARGGPVACPPPGTLSRLGAAMREPVGRIHWAGTEAADRWTGYMDGAVRAGEAAAAAALAALQSDKEG